MGAGKSMVARELSSRTKRKMISTDQLIEQKEKRSIKDIFSQSGEAYFRQLEKDAVREVSGMEGVIIDCGGGVVLAAENLASLKKKGVVFYLKATPEVILSRVKNAAHRPLLKGLNPEATIRELLEKREPLYTQADHTIDCNAPSIDPVCRKILEIIETS